MRFKTAFAAFLFSLIVGMRFSAFAAGVDVTVLKKADATTIKALVKSSTLIVEGTVSGGSLCRGGCIGSVHLKHVLMGKTSLSPIEFVHMHWEIMGKETPAIMFFKGNVNSSIQNSFAEVNGTWLVGVDQEQNVIEAIQNNQAAIAVGNAR